MSNKVLQKADHSYHNTEITKHNKPPNDESKKLLNKGTQTKTVADYSTLCERKYKQYLPANL